MKFLKSLIPILCLSFLFSGCVSTVTPPTSTPLPLPSPSQSQEPIESPDITTENPSETEYINEKLSFRIDLPSNVVAVENPDSNIVDFYIDENKSFAIFTSLLEETNENSVLISSINGKIGYFEKTYREEDQEIIDNLIYSSFSVVTNYQGLSKTIYYSRNVEDNKYINIYSPELPNDMALEILGLNNEDLNDYAISLSFMNVKAYCVAIISPKEGKEDLVKEKLNTYIENTQTSFEQYLQDQYEIAKNAEILTINGKIILVMAEDKEEIVEKINQNI